MPKIYEYLGIIIVFYSNEHAPIHIHAICGEFQSKAEIIIVDGKIIEIIISPVKGYEPLRDKDNRNLKVFLEKYSEKIVQKWIDYFVYCKEVEFERISRKIK